MSKGLPVFPKPENYVPPTWTETAQLLEALKKRRQPVIDRIWETKRVRRGQWSEVVSKIPKAYRKMILTPDMPVVRDMIQRVVGMITKSEPTPQVLPPSPHARDVDKAAKEEARLHALRVQVEDQQDRPTYAMGVDAQAAWGESWISVWPDPSFFTEGDYKRKKDEDAGAYVKRYSAEMAMHGVPLCFDDHDSQSVFDFRGDRNRLSVCMVESEHAIIDLELGMGYKPIRDHEGKILEWAKTGATLSEAYLPGEARSDTMVNDTTHVLDITGGGLNTGGQVMADRTVKKVVFMDPWTYQCYLDGVLVEQWEHDFGVVPMFPAYGEQTSDRDPGWQSVGIADAAITVAKQVVYFAAIMASNAVQHGFPTPFLKNPAAGLVHPVTGEFLTRKVQLGEMNILGDGEEIEFPYLNAQMMPDFFKHMDWLTGQLKSATLSDFGQAIGTDIAGYAIAQIRSMQLSILSTIYSNARRQWRKIFYFLRHLVRKVFMGGLWLRGAVDVDEDGHEFRPIMRYAPEDCTDFPIEVEIEEGIAQDEIAERKSALELMQAGVWSVRRVMEKTGVDDPAREEDEIATYRMANSAEADQNVLAFAMEIAAKRWAMTEQQRSTPFMQALERVRGQTFNGGPGQFQNQASAPANASPDGTPLGQQQPAMAPPAGEQRGGPASGPAPGVGGTMGLPGGAAGVMQTPVGSPG